MSVPIRLFMVGVLVWLALPWLGHAEEPQQQPSEPAVSCVPLAPQTDPPEVILQADSLEYFSTAKRVVAQGKVTVFYGTTRLFADRMELNTDSGIGTATGNIRFLTPDDELEAARLDFDLTAERGLVYEATGTVAGRYRVSGEQFERLGPRRYKVKQGRLTTCTGMVPDWEFRTKQARIGLGNYVTLQQPSFWVKGVPVFYLPYMVFPIRDERTTGLLPPHFGASRRDGAIVGGEFFWAITDWMDSTLGLEYLSERGWKPDVEWRYAIDPLSDGRLTGSFIHDRQTGDDLWQVRLQQRQEFGWGIRGLSQVDQRSERDLARRFARDLQQESQVRRDSFGTLTKLWQDSSLTVAAASFEGIPDSGNDAHFRRLPQARFEQFLTPLFGLAFVAIEASYSRLHASDIRNDTPIQRLDIFPRLTVPLTVAPWLRFTATGGLRETFYDRRTTADATVSRVLPDLSAHLEGPTLWRRYAWTDSRALIHLLTMRLAYRYVPHIDQADVPPFETLDEAEHFLDPLETQTLIDRINPAHYAKLSVINRLFMRGGDAGQIREVASLRMSQGFDIRAATVGSGQPLGPLDLDALVHLWQQWQLQTRARLQPATGTLQAANWRLAGTLWPGWSAHLAGRHRQAPDILYVSGGVQAALVAGLHVGYSMRYDALDGAFREHVATLRYEAQCWSVDMRLRVRDAGDTDFLIRANLAFAESRPRVAAEEGTKRHRITVSCLW